MKRVLLIADSNMSLSGVPVVYMSIVRLLHNEYIFDLIVLKDNDMFFKKEFLSYGGNIFHYNFNKPNGLLKKTLWLLTYSRKVNQFLSNTVHIDNYSVIHSFNEGFSYPFIKKAKKQEVNSRILHICSPDSSYPQKKTLSRFLYNWYQKKAKRLCTNIAFVSKKSLEYNDYKGKGIVLYNIYDENKFGTIIKCKHKDLVLTQIGTFSVRKNQLFSLEVVNSIKSSIPSVKLIIMGKELENGYLDKMNNYINSNNLKDNIYYCDKGFDRVKLNEETSFIIYPSTMESFGLVLIESQACGIHCFANKNIPNDADMGNVDFIELDTTTWANKIIDYFRNHGNKRNAPKNIEKFSTSQFRQTLNKLYGN